MFKTIVVGTDGSTEADSGFNLAATLAKQDQARLVVVHVQEFVGGKGGIYPLHIDEDEIVARIRAGVEALSSSGVAAELVIEHVPFGGPAHVIAEVADKADADLIVVGNKGRNPVSELLLGNVPIRLLHIARRPVLVVPACEPGAASS